MDKMGALCDEQNGFRKNRLCLHHIFTLNTIVRNKCHARKEGIFAAFVDFRKAFDVTDRELLYCALIEKGVTGPFLDLIRQLYMNTTNILQINQELSSHFRSEIGVKQGDNLSPSCFCQFINSLIKELQQIKIGVNIGSRKLCCLAYADDIVLLAENEKDLNKLLHTLENWCSRWRVLINTDKTKVMHFRRRRIKQSSFPFRVGNTELETVDKYKYLGTTIGCFPDDSVITEELSKSGSRALGQIISKTKSNLDVGYKTFTRLFHSGVAPILDYGSGAWCIGNSVNCGKLDKIEQCAVRYFAGLPKNSPILTLAGDIGWTPGIVCRDVEVLRLYNQIVQMPSHRLT